MPASDFGYVYWLYDDTCTDIERHGYVGACLRLDVRLRAHRRYAGSRKGAIGVPTASFQVGLIYMTPFPPHWAGLRENHSVSAGPTMEKECWQSRSMSRFASAVAVSRNAGSAAGKRG